MYLNKIIRIFLTSVCFVALSNLLIAGQTNEAKTSKEFLEEVGKKINSIDTKTLSSMLKKNPNLKIIDVRSTQDIVAQKGFIKANKITRIPRGELEFRISEEVKANEKFVLYCLDGRESLLATKQLHDMGYKNAIHYKGGYQAWNKQKLPTNSLDRYIQSPLYSKVSKVAKGVYASIGITAPSRYESNGHNNNLGFVIGKKYVLVWNGGSSYLLAKALHDEIKLITPLPVKYVVIENSQGHAMLGSSYWQEQGATIVAQENVKKEIEEKGERIYARIESVLKDKFIGTKLTMPDKFFKDKISFDLGGRIVEARYFGYAHERSDISLWLPKERIIFAGDLAFNGRLLPIFKITQTLKWLEAWEKFEALKPKIIVPGHGYTTDLKTVRKYTKGYLVFLREEVEKIIDEDGGLEEAYSINQDAYAHLDTFKELSNLNAAQLFAQMEFE